MKVFCKEKNGINYLIDTRIELWNVIMLVAGNPEINHVDLNYKLEIVNRFGKYKHHPVIQFIRKYGPQGKLFTSIDAPVWYMLSVTPDLNWRRDMSNPYEKEPLMDSLRLLVRKFSLETGFSHFFNENADFYDRSLSDLLFNREGDEKQRLLRYYGEKNSKTLKFNVILNFLGFGNFGPRLETAGGRELYAIIAPTGSYANLPTFSLAELDGLIWHEFGHAFANQLIEENMTAFNRCIQLWNPVRSQMASQAYHEWKVILWEYLVNAVMCRLAAERSGENYAELTYERNLLGNDWIYLPPLLSALREYESKRMEYPTLRSFMPVIVRSFQQITPEQIAFLHQKRDNMRRPDVANMPSLGDIYGKKNVLFIVSSKEENAPAHSSLIQKVKEHQKHFFPSAAFVTDTVATGMDLSRYHLFVIGTLQGNRLLQQVITQLPVVVKQTELVVGKKYSGDGYVFMSGWINPFNTQNTMVIYAAQDPEYLINFAQIPRGGTHFHLAKGVITLKAGNYIRRNSVWMCP